MRPSCIRCSAFLLLVLHVAACGVDVPTPPEVVPPGSLGGEAALPTLLAGAVGDFAVAYGGRVGLFGVEHAGAILIGGLLTDELGNSAEVADWVSIDQRTVTEFNTEDQAFYLNLHRARVSAERAAESYATFDRTAIGRAYSLDLAGYAYVFFGEMFCGDVPFSRADDQGNIGYGAPLTTPEILARAIARFDTTLGLAPALAAAHPDDVASVDRYVGLARVGKARALLDLGDYQNAALSANAVPTEFDFSVQYGTNTEREKNAVYHFNQVDISYVVSDSEGVNGVPFVSGGDARTPADSGGSGVDGTTPFYLELVYPSYDSPIPLATGLEARLIEAEALLAAGDASGAMGRLNDLRAAAGIAPLQDPGSPDGRVSLLFRERALWLWLTAHRLGDMRRLVVEYGRAPGTVYPAGRYRDKGSYGTTLVLPVTVDERTNPLYDASACNTTLQ
jgi:starch-binding outer membrane protein, SusD/RagB family